VYIPKQLLLAMGLNLKIALGYTIEIEGKQCVLKFIGVPKKSAVHA
jgi:hypothetical protein